MKQEIGKYWGYMLMEYRRSKMYFGDTIVRLLLTGLRLMLPWGVFLILVKEGKMDMVTAKSMVWAVMIGQAIYYSTGRRIHNVIREEIRTGEISTRISEPINYIGAKLSQNFGFFVPNFLFLLIIFGTILSFFAPTNINWFQLLFMSLISYLLVNMVNIFVGLTSFIIEENDGIFYITSKMFLILGNQIIPVALMPLWVVGFAKYTPFYLGLAGPIEVASGRLDFTFAIIVGIVNIAIMMAINQFMLSKLRKLIIING